jgi:hypothetical protein
MALRTPPSWLQQGSHPAENDRLTMQAIFNTTGIIGASSMAISAQGSPNMTVNAAAGWAAIVGTTQSNMGVYVAYNDAPTVLTITTANPTNPRIDRIVATVNDAYYTGATNNVTFTVIAGTPAGSPSAPATPANSISLATVAVAAAATSITAGNITDTRVATTSTLVDTSTFVSLTGTQTLTNKTLTSPVINGAALEAAFTTGTGFAGYTFLATTNGAVQFSTANATANGTVNITSASGVTLNSVMAVNQSITLALLVTNGATAYYPTAYQVDGSAVTPKWAGGTAPTAGNASSIDVYTFTIIKTASATFTVLASQTRFA